MAALVRLKYSVFQSKDCKVVKRTLTSDVRNRACKQLSIFQFLLQLQPSSSPIHTYLSSTLLYSRQSQTLEMIRTSDHPSHSGLPKNTPRSPQTTAAGKAPSEQRSQAVSEAIFRN